MARPFRMFTLAGLALVTMVVLAAGCKTGFIADAARDSAASFLTDVFSTAVDESIGKD